MLVRMSAALVAVVALAVPAAAAPSCRMLVDRQGDGEVFRSSGYPATRNDPALDIVSADLASDDRVLTAVVRVLDLDDPQLDAATGAMYAVSFALGTRNRQVFGVRAWRSAFGEAGARVAVFTSEISGRWVGAASVVFDEARNEVRMTVALSILRRYADATPGTPAGELRASSATYFDEPPQHPFNDNEGGSIGADDGASALVYRLRSPSCLRPGT